MKPPPIAKPLTAAMTGFCKRPVCKGSTKFSSTNSFGDPGMPLSIDSFISSPAQKPLPVPVKIATSRSLSSWNLLKASAIPFLITVLKAFNLSGRFNRTIIICPSISVSTKLIKSLLNSKIIYIIYILKNLASHGY